MGNREAPLYTPLLKAKQAEFDALKHITPDVNERLMPLVEVPPSPRDRDTRKRKPIREHLAPVAPKLARAWTSDRPFLLDGPRRGDDQPDRRPRAPGRP